MTVDELAKKLHGNEYENEISKELAKEAKENNLVVVFGYSDDNMEFRGAIYDEIDCDEGGVTYLTHSGLIENECEAGENCPYYRLKFVPARYRKE